jgi:hypothetical protein
MKNVIRKESVEIKVNIPKGTPLGSSVKFNFTDNENLRNVKLWGVQTFYKGQENARLGLNNQNGILIKDLDYQLDLLSKDEFQRCFLNLYDINNDNFLIQAPFVIFQTIQNVWSKGGTPLPPPLENPDGDIVERDTKYFSGQLLDLQNSFISFWNDKPFSDAEFSIVIDIYYSRIDLDTLVKLN